MGFVSYLHGFYLSSFQIAKSHSYNGYSIYITIFNSFLQGVYPVSMTEVQPYFTHIIGHNSVNVNQIPTKLGAKIHFNEPFKCAKFQPDWITNWYFMAGFAKCMKRRRKKTKKLKQNFGCSYFENVWSNFLQIRFVDFSSWAALL